MASDTPTNRRQGGGKIKSCFLGKIGKFGKRPFSLRLGFPGPSRSAHPVPCRYLVSVIPGQPQVLPFRRSNTLSWLTLGTPKLHGRPPRKRGVLGRKDEVQGSGRKTIVLNFEKSKNEKSKSEKVSF